MQCRTIRHGTAYNIKAISYKQWQFGRISPFVPINIFGPIIPINIFGPIRTGNKSKPHVTFALVANLSFICQFRHKMAPLALVANFPGSDNNQILKLLTPINHVLTVCALSTIFVKGEREEQRGSTHRIGCPVCSELPSSQTS